MKKTRKLLYLLQLEDYSNSRYFSWLKKHPLELLRENKGSLKWTTRVILILIISLPKRIFSPPSKSLAQANQIVAPIFTLVQEAISLLAKIKLLFYPKLKKIIITGSYGKTTLKEMLTWVLGLHYPVLPTPGNVNTKIGIAKTVLQKLHCRHKIMIVEAGAYQKGEIKAICQLIKPQFGLITIFGFMHLERFGNFASLKAAKKEIIPFIESRQNLFYPKKDNHFINFNQTVRSIALKLGLSDQEISQRLTSFQPPPHRLVQIKIKDQVILLDDSYNANPFGAKKALKKLASFKNHQKIVVTPGMIEFGSKQFYFNYHLGQEAARAANLLVIVGETNKKALLKGAKSHLGKTQIITLKSNEDWQEYLTAYLRPPTAILLENDLPDHYF